MKYVVSNHEDRLPERQSSVMRFYLFKVKKKIYTIVFFPLFLIISLQIGDIKKRIRLINFINIE